MPPKKTKTDGARALLIDKARSSRTTIVLGAGISCSVGVPTWGALVERLWRDAFPRRALPKPAPLLYPQLLELLARKLGDPEVFHERLRRALYAALDGRTLATPGTSEKSLACVARALHRDRREGSHIARVITFNVDDLLEQSLAALAPSALVIKPIARASHHPRGDGSAVSVYHLHGFLPQHPRARWHEQAADSLVFTDAQYWATVAQPASFANRVMQFALHDSHCVFIGCSMTDLNIVRWLSVHAAEVEEDKRRQFAKRPARSPAAEQRAIKAALSRHFWIHTRDEDAGGFLGAWLSSRGVESVTLDDWCGPALDTLLREAFPGQRAARSRAR